MLLQLPIFLGLFWVIKDFADDKIPDYVYSFFHSFGSHYTSLSTINTHFFGIDLLAPNSVFLTILAAILIFLQTKLTTLAKPLTPSIP